MNVESGRTGAPMNKIRKEKERERAWKQRQRQLNRYKKKRSKQIMQLKGSPNKA